MKARLITGIILLALTVTHLAGVAGENTGIEKFNSKSQCGFIKNKGQIIDQNNKPNPSVLYLLNTPGMNVQLKRGGFSYDLYSVKGSQGHKVTGAQGHSGTVAQNIFSPSHHLTSSPSDSIVNYQLSIINYHRIDFTLLSSNPKCQVIPSSPAADYLNYYTAGAPDKGITGIRHFSKVTCKDIYPNIDLEFVTGPEQGFKYNFIIRPGGDISRIRMKIAGPGSIALVGEKLILTTSLGDAEEVIPESYLLNGDAKTTVKAHFREISKGVYGFTVEGDVPRSSTLIIDPTTIRLWGTYYGGFDWDAEAQCSVDKNGNVFIGGATMSLNNIATSGLYQPVLAGIIDGFLVKFNAAGQRQWGTYFGGALSEELGSCMVSNSGDIYVAGRTNSTSGIASAGAHQPVYGGGNYDCYIEKFNQAGMRLWGTYYGGTLSDFTGILTVDKFGNVFLAGTTWSEYSIATTGSYQPTINGLTDAFLAKFNSDGVRQWGTYYGGGLSDIAMDCTSDSTGNVYIAGTTGSIDNIASFGAYQTEFGGWDDGFLAKFNTDGQRLWSTYYGGTGSDLGYGCCTDNLQNVCLSGRTLSVSGIATTGCHQPALGGNQDAFIVKFNGQGVRQWGTYYGGSDNEYGFSCTAGRNNDIFMAGTTQSPDNISTADSYQPVKGGYGDAYVVKFNATGVRQWGTYYGGNFDDQFLKCIFRSDTLYLSGDTYSTTNIASPGACQITLSGDKDDMLVKFLECLPVSAAGPITGRTSVHQNSNAVPYSIPPLAFGVNYIWTLPPGASIASGAGTNSITVNFSGTATSGNICVKGENKCGEYGVMACLFVNLYPETFGVGFIAPDTICITQTVTIIDTTTLGTTYYWNFCSGNNNNDPAGTNIGNPQGTLNQPTYITLVKQGTDCFSFTTNQLWPGVSRHHHGSSFRNNPVSSVNLGSFGLLTLNKVEGIQVKNDNGHWYGFVNNDVNIVRLDFGTSLWNTPTALTIPVAGMNLGHGLAIYKEGNTWIGFISNALGNDLLRLNFGATLSNLTPAVQNLGNVAGFSHPNQMQLIQEAGQWYIFIMNSLNNSLSRITFGTSLLNTPAGTNLGNVGGLNSPVGISINSDCSSTTGYFTNWVNNGEIGKLTFNGGLSGTVIGTVLTYLNTYNHPHSFSELFRENDSLFLYTTISMSSELLKLSFPPCTNASIGSSTLYNPPPFTFNAAGTYNIRLLVDDGLPTQTSVCKPIVVMDPPVVNLGPDGTICPNTSRVLDAGSGFISYLWSTGATTQTITITGPGTYWVNATRWGCTVTSTIHLTQAPAPVITISGNTVVFQGATEVYTTQPGMTGYTWTFSGGGSLVSGGTPADNTITIQWNTNGIQWVRVNYTNSFGCTALTPAQLNVNVVLNLGIMAPDTICINQPVNITNTTSGGTTYYWNFCSGNAMTNPLATNIGNPGGMLTNPIYMTLVEDGNDHFSFVSNQGYPGFITRNYHGNSFRNNPSASVNMLQAGEIDHSVEAIQIKKDANGNWYGFLNNNTTITRLNFGTSLWNIPTTTDLGPFPNIGVAHGSAIIKEGTIWLGFFDSSPTANKLSRLNFGTSLANIPTYEDLGDVGGFSWPCQLAVVTENGLNYMLVINYLPGSLSRVSFGSSLLNTPTGVNLGNGGAILSSTGLTALNDCQTSVGYYTEYLPVPNAAIGKLSFPNGIAGTFTATNLGNTGGFGRPSSFSQVFRQNDSLYAYVTNRDSYSLTRLAFPPCNNATPISSTLFTPPPVTYNLAGTYNIRLVVDEGLLTETSACRPIVVMDPPIINLGNDMAICEGYSVTLDAGAGFDSYLWSTGATTRTITVSTPGNYSVTATRWGCESSDNINLSVAQVPTVNLGPDQSVCSPQTATFDAGFCYGCTYLWANLTTGQMNIGTNQTLTTGQAGHYLVTVADAIGCQNLDDIILTVSPPLPPVSITISPSANPVCAGTPVTFTATPISPGNTPVYQWKVNAINVNNANNAVYTYTPLNGDVVTCVLASDALCTTGSPATSNPITMIVDPLLPVTISISPSANPVCTGSPVTFTATAGNEGSTPAYQWKVNGGNVGTGLSNYTYVPASGDLVSCILTSSNTTCVSNNPATSNTIVMGVDPIVPAGVTIAAEPNPYCTGNPVTITATPGNGGLTPQYLWKVNDITMTATGPIYTYTPVNGDQVRCYMTSILACITNNPATSNNIVLTENSNFPASVNVTASANPFCPGTSVTYTALPTNGGTLPSYQWQVNGVNTGANLSTYTYSPQPGDSIRCIMTSNLSCVTGSPASSDKVIMSALPLPAVTFTTCFDTITTINAKPIKLKGGLPYGGTYSGPGVNSTTGIFTPSAAGVGTHIITYTYTNSLLCSAINQLSIINYQLSIFNCGSPLTDIRDNKVYPTVQIGTQCWMQTNLDFGSTINDLIQQTDNCIVEKYSRNSGLGTRNSYYQWDEVMRYDPTPGLQGLCPPGWHVPDETEWNTLFNFYQGNARAGYPLQDPYLNGFKAQQNGVYYLNSLWSFTDFATLFWSSTVADQARAYAHGMNTIDQSVSVYAGVKANGFSVRCLKD